MAREQLTNVDTALLRLEDPTNPMMITGAIIFKDPVDFERLKETIGCCLLSIERFQQKVVWSRLGLVHPHWEEDPNFDFNYHLQRTILPKPGDQAALQKLVSLLASTPLDFSRPLWQFHLVEEYGDGSALVCRIHHSIADGMALVHVILSMTECDPNDPLSKKQQEFPSIPSLDPLDSFLQPARDSFFATRRAVDAQLRKSREILANPNRVHELSTTGRDAATEIGKLIMLEHDPDTVLRGKLGTSKKAAWSAAVPLDDIKTIRRRLGGTVNDVLLTTMTGALRHYMQARGDSVDNISIRAAVPVNLRPPGKEAELSNRMGAIFLSLPVGIADPTQRLHELERRMNGHKGSMQAPLIYHLLNALGMAPGKIANSLINIFGHMATVVMTNVKGPQEQLYLAGSPIETMMFFVPSTGRLGVGVSILSYAGEVRLGVITDERLVPDPENIIAAFHAEFHSLHTLALEVEEQISFEAISLKLDDAIHKLDSMIENGAAVQADAGVDQHTS